MKITLENFQAHALTVIEAAETLTAITGVSNHGKTSIIRALKLVRDNRPLGKKYIRHGEDVCTVTVDNVQRVIGKSINCYKVDGETYEALKGSIPEEVTAALNLGPENIQEQLRDNIFLLNDTPGKRAAKLSELTDLQQAKATLTILKEQKTATNAEISVTKKLQEDNALKVKALENTGLMNVLFAKIERKNARCEQLKQTHTQLSNAIQTVRDDQATLSKTDFLPNTQVALSKLIATRIECDALQAKEEQLENILLDIEDDTAILSLDPKKLIIRVARIKELLDESNKLQNAIEQVKAADRNVKGIEREEAELKEWWDENTDGTRFCPLCNGNGVL